MKGKIKGIVFDFGGVIQTSKGSPLPRIAEIINAPLEEVTREYFKYNHLSNVANMRWEDMILHVIEKFDPSPEMREQVVQWAIESHTGQELNRELLLLIQKIRSAGYIVALLSNYVSSLRTELEAYGIDTLFDEVVISGEIGFQKPQKEAFQILFERIGLLPHEVIFIDDTPKSLEGADRIGYTPILFQSNASLIEALKVHGVAIPF